MGVFAWLATAWPCMRRVFRMPLPDPACVGLFVWLALSSMGHSNTYKQAVAATPTTAAAATGTHAPRGHTREIAIMVNQQWAGFAGDMLNYSQYPPANASRHNVTQVPPLSVWWKPLPNNTAASFKPHASSRFTSVPLHFSLLVSLPQPPSSATPLPIAPRSTTHPRPPRQFLISTAPSTV